MTKKTKTILKACGIALVIFMAACWYCDYRYTHEEIVDAKDIGTLSEATGNVTEE